MDHQPRLPQAYTEYMDAFERLTVARSDRSRRRALTEEMAAERARLDALAQDLTREQGDVDALESFTLRSILARLRGRLDEQLTAEEAEVEAIRLEIAVRNQALADLQAAADRTGVVSEAQLQAAERAKAEAQQRWEAERLAVDSPTANRLAEFDDSHAHLIARLREVAEARDAAEDTIAALGGALADLGSAASWSSYDTFFGGGLFASVVKHNRVDRAARLIAVAQRSLLRLHAELADLREPSAPVADLASPTLRAVDVWFDNLLSDWMVHSRIKASLQSVEASLASVQETATGLETHRQEVEAELQRLAVERESMLLEPPSVG